MNKIWALFMSLMMCGCSLSTVSAPERAFTIEPFTSMADVIWCGEDYTAAVLYEETGILSISLEGGALETPVVFSIGNGCQTIKQGELVFSQPIEEILPSSIASQFYTGITKLSALPKVKADENGEYIFSSGAVSAVVSESGEWKKIILENGSFAFNDFTFPKK